MYQRFEKVTLQRVLVAEIVKKCREHVRTLSTRLVSA